MRAKGREHGRFVSLSGLRKVSAPEGSRFPLLIIDGTGLPVFPLCEWYRQKKEYDSGRTSDTYLEMALPYFGFLLQKGYAWNDHPDRIRAYLVEFLRSSVVCQVGPAHEDGYLVETTGASPLKKSSLGVLLASLTSVYDLLSVTRYYPYQNPLRSERLTKLKQEHLLQVKNAGAPDHAGIRSETHQETYQNYPTTYFRQKRGKIWKPEVLMEPNVVHERMRETVNYMIKHATFQRDQIILLLLRQTGARLSEIIEMTVGGYRNAHHNGRALVKNKGSRGREEKMVYFTDTIDKQLFTYIRTERARYDLYGHKRLDQLADGDAIFLTEDGNPYNRSAFYYHWNRLFEPAQTQFEKQERVEFSPHDIRHLSVTQRMLKIKEEAKGNETVEKELKEGFSQLMGWRSFRTMETYTHTLKERDALLRVMLEEDEEDQGFQAEQRGMPKAGNHDNISSIGIDKFSAISRPANDDEFSWYEEE